jgi:integrase
MRRGRTAQDFHIESIAAFLRSALLNDGVTLKMVFDRLGHSSIQITADVYGVTEEKRQREVSERLERLFGSGKN